jgi:hypothetical protein
LETDQTADSIDFCELYKQVFRLEKRWNVTKSVGILLCGSAKKEVNLVFDTLCTYLEFLKINLRVDRPSYTTVGLLEGVYYNNSPWKREQQDFSVLNIGQARKWFPSYRGSTFQWMPIWFVFRISDLLTKQHEIYDEFHGTLGEAKESNQVICAVTLFMDVQPHQVPKGFSLDTVLKILHIFPTKVSSDHLCPYYAGPVTILLNVFFPTDEVYQLWKTAKKFIIPFENWHVRVHPIVNDRIIGNVANTFQWLCCQPSHRPQFGSEMCTILCTLLDKPHTPSPSLSHNPAFYSNKWRRYY